MEAISKLTFAQACKLDGKDAKKVTASLQKSFDFFSPKEKAAHIAHAMCTIMVKAANRIANHGKPWKANHKDSNQDKYEARWYHDGGSSGFRYYGYDGWLSHSNVGSRLSFISYICMVALCQDNKEFIKLWNKYAL